MAFALLFIFIIIPVVELTVLIEVGEDIGGWNTVLLCLLTAIVGGSLVRSQGVSTLLQAQQKMTQGESPGQEVLEGIMLAGAGVFLVIPGFVTDFLGMLLLIPFLRQALAKRLFKNAQVQMNSAQGFQHSSFQQNPFQQYSNQQGNTFEGDFETKQEDAKQLPPLDGEFIAKEGSQRRDNDQQDWHKH